MLPSDSPFHDDMTLREAREVLRTLVEDGCICPLCTLRAQVYKRPINGTMARSLIEMYRAWGRAWGDLPKLRREAGLHHSNQEGMLAWFGLIEEEQVRRPDGGRAGFWRITELGERWVHGETTISKYARTYGGRVLQLLGKQVTIHDVLPTHFNYREVMAGVVRERSAG